MDIDELVSKYRQLRDLKKQKEEEHKAALQPINEMMERLEALFLTEMNRMGLQSLPTKNGTPYKTTRTSVTVADWDSALAFVQDHNMWHLLEKRLAKTAVQEYRAEHNDLPPGVNWREETVVNVRSS
jgi:hypothetical protein